MRRRALLGVALVLASCADRAPQTLKMYSGPDLPASDVATVTSFFERHRLIVTLRSVDGVEVPQSHMPDCERKTTAILAPGTHVIGFDFLYSPHLGEQIFPEKRGSLTLHMERGHHYEINVGRDPPNTDTALSIPASATFGITPLLGGGQTWYAWVVDGDATAEQPPSN